MDIKRVAEACRARNVVSVIDNTFASPLNQRPLAMGVDLAMQSATKYLNGHSDVTAGVVCGSRALVRPVEMARRKLGGVLDPQAAYALNRSLKTLEFASSATTPTRWRLRPRSRHIRPSQGCSTRAWRPIPITAIAKCQMSGFGGMVCIDVRGGEAAACRAFDRLKVIKRAASLGGTESVCSLPILTSHWGHTDAQLEAAGISKGMMRLSIGLEDPRISSTISAGAL